MINSKDRLKATMTMLIIPCVFIMTLSVPATAAGYFVKSTAIVIGIAERDYLNMRKWPSSRSVKVGKAAPGASVWVERCIIKANSSDWCKVSWMHMSGWVNSRYLDLR